MRLEMAQEPWGTDAPCSIDVQRREESHKRVTHLYQGCNVSVSILTYPLPREKPWPDMNVDHSREQLLLRSSERIIK